MRRISITIAALCSALALLAPAAAHASHSQTMTFDAPRDMRNPATRERAFAQIASLGVHSLRVVLQWHDVAPRSNSRVRPNFDETDPNAYDWSIYDPIVDGAKQRGWSVLLTVSSPVPRWATNGARDTLTRPRSSDFGEFMTAVGRHYATKVDTWGIWNEPNQPQFLLPQFSAHGHEPLSPGIYRNLYLAGQRGLRAAGLGRAPLLIGETSPRGPGHVVAPLAFLRGMLCLNGSYHRTRKCPRITASGYAHHAYTTGEGPGFKPPQRDDVTIGVLPRLVRALDLAGRRGAITKHLSIYLTEFGIESVPDPLRGVGLAAQSDFRSISERIAYANSRVAGFSQYLLRDDPPVKGAKGLARFGGFQTGLEFAGGKKKPSFDGFRLPLAAKRSGSRVSLWGLVRPATGKTSALLQWSSNGRTWHTLATVRTNSRGYFMRKVALRSGRRWRLQWTSPSATTFRGTATRLRG
jgi:Cellulase (glycosyl hydrolase family 5)